MQFNLLLLAALPSTWARPTVNRSMNTYSAPPDLMAKVQTQDDCILPHNYTIRDFKAQTNNTGSTLSAFNFEFEDEETKITTLCHFNSTSESTTPEGLTPRFNCEHGEVKFIWEDDDRDLWMIERVCPGPDGAAEYEASGSVHIPLSCSSGNCRTNATEHKSTFTSLQPVQDPTH